MGISTSSRVVPISEQSNESYQLRFVRWENDS
jgi:hypothetical protein